MLPENVFALASVEKISINALEFGVIVIGDVICGITEVQ